MPRPFLPFLFLAALEVCEGLRYEEMGSEEMGSEEMGSDTEEMGSDTIFDFVPP